MNPWVCGRCNREAGVAYVCEDCHKHVCKMCIEFKGGRQICLDCADKEAKDELVPA